MSVDDDWNYVHNLMYAIANLMEQGRLEAANALSDHLAAARGQVSESLYIWSARDQITRVSRRLPVALRIGDWSAVIAMLDQAQLASRRQDHQLALPPTELHSFAHGMQALDRGDVAKGDLAAAQAASARWMPASGARARTKGGARAKADTEKNKTEPKAKSATATGKNNTPSTQPVTDPINPDAYSGPLVKTLSIASVELRAGVELLKGNTTQAKKLFDQAIQAEKKLGYHEPPSTSDPSLKPKPRHFCARRTMPAPKRPFRKLSKSVQTRDSSFTASHAPMNSPATPSRANRVPRLSHGLALSRSQSPAESPTRAKCWAQSNTLATGWHL